MTHQKNAPKEAAMDTAASIWQHASEEKKTLIQSILKNLLKQAHVLKWELTEKPHVYKLELDQEVLGTHPDVPFGELVLRPVMRIAFYETKIPGTNQYRQEIAFPDQGVYHRVKFGWLAKETGLERILIEEDQQQQIWCTIEGLGQKMVKSADYARDFWDNVQWSKA